MYEKINISVLYACLDKTIIIIISIIIIVMELNNSSASSFYDFTKFYICYINHSIAVTLSSKRIL